MASQIVVAFRMPAAGLVDDPEARELPFLARARSLCGRAEALGARLVSWSGTGLALAWDKESIESAVLLTASIHEETLTRQRGWAAGMAEGELEPVAVGGERLHLASGAPLIVAEGLARVARACEVLIDPDVRSLRNGQLAVLGARTVHEGGQRVRGWRLDLEHPWKRAGTPLAAAASSERVFRFVRPVTAATNSSGPAPPLPRPTSRLEARVRQLASEKESPEGDTDTLSALSELRLARAAAESGSSSARCQSALALAMTLLIAHRPDEALLEALDALARAREADDAKAIGACKAVLAKAYAAAGHGSQGSALLQSGPLVR